MHHSHPQLLAISVPRVPRHSCRHHTEMRPVGRSSNSPGVSLLIREENPFQRLLLHSARPDRGTDRNSSKRDAAAVRAWTSQEPILTGGGGSPP